MNRIVTILHPSLKEICIWRNADISYLRILVNDLKDTMDGYNGAGIAAPQIGINDRIIYIKDIGEMLNPTILEKSFETESDWEGCLSIPLIQVQVNRSKKIKISYHTLNNSTPQTITLVDTLARVVLHEIDHLDGKLITDYPSKVRVSLPVKPNGLGTSLQN